MHTRTQPLAKDSRHGLHREISLPPTCADRDGGRSADAAITPAPALTPTSSGPAQKARVFTTAAVPAEQRIALWQAHNSAALMRLRCRTLADRQFDGTTVNVQLPRTRLSRLKAETPHVIERQSDLIRGQPEDAVVLFGKAGLNTAFENLEGFPADWKTNPAAFVKFVRDHQCNSFLEYAEYPYFPSDEIKKALAMKAAFAEMLEQMQ